MFVIVGLIMTVTVGALMSLMITSGVKSRVKRVVITTVLSLAIGFGLSGLFTLERNADVASWNNGSCECGGSWHLVNVERLRNAGELYYYGCEECGACITTHSNMN